MVVAVGLTLTVIVGAVPLNDVPSDNVPDSVPVPATDNVKFAEFPVHIAWVPLIAPVGRAFTVITALPFLSDVREVHLLLFNVAIV